MKSLFTLVLTVLFVNPVFANKLSLDEYLNTEIQSTLESFNEVEQTKPQAPDEGWYQNTMRLRVRAKLGLEVSWLAKAEVKPSVEYIWKRKNPAGYQAYKPRK